MRAAGLRGGVGSLVTFFVATACGTAASVGVPPAADDASLGADGGSGDGSSASGSVRVIVDTPLAGTVKDKPFVARSISFRLEADRRVLTLRDYASNCGVTQGSLPSPDSVAVHVRVKSTGPGEETITYADDHAATFQLGIEPPNVQTVPARRGRLRLDTFSTTPGEIVKGGLVLESDVGFVSGTFEATVCAP